MLRKKALSLKNIDSLGWKNLFLVAVLLLCAGGAMWGEDFRFRASTTSQKAGASNNWDKNNDAWQYFTVFNNWGNVTDHPGKSRSGDNVYFYGEEDATCNVNVTPANALGTIYVNRTKDSETGKDGPTTLNIASGVTLTVENLYVAGGTLNVTGGGKLKITEKCEISSRALVIFNMSSASQISINSFYNNGTIKCPNEIHIECKGYDNGGNGKITFTDDNSSMKVNRFFSDINQGSQYQKLIYTFTGADPINAYAEGTTIEECSVENGDGRNLDLRGGTYESFSWKNCANGTLEINSNVTINKIVLSGKGSGSDEQLKITGTGTITTDSVSDDSGQYLKFINKETPKVTGRTITITDSIPESEGYFPEGWIDGATDYTWSGATDTDWFKGSNWSTGIVPSDKKNIIIPDLSAGVNRYPVVLSGKNLDVGDLTIGGELEVKSTLTVNGTTSGGKLKVNNAAFKGNVSSVSSIEVSGNLSYSGSSFSCDTVSFTQGNHNVSGAITFTNLSAESGANLYFESGKKQSVSGNLKLNGTSASGIVLDSIGGSGTWEIDVAPSKVTASYVKVSNSVSTNNIPAVIRLDKNYNCTDGGNNTNWFAETVVYWIGNTDNNWSESSNWETSKDGGITFTDVLVAPLFEDEYLEVFIKDTSKNHPVLTSGVKTKNLTVLSGTKIDLDGQNLKVLEKYSNTGTVISNGTETVTLSSDTTENGTWEFTGGTMKEIDNLSYNDISVKGTVSLGSDILGKAFSNTGTVDVGTHSLSFDSYSGTGNVNVAGGKIKSSCDSSVIKNLEVTDSCELNLNTTVSNVKFNSIPNITVTVSAGKTVTLPPLALVNKCNVVVNGTLNTESGDSYFGAVEIGTSGTLNIKGDLSVSGNLISANKIDVLGTLSVGGTSTLNGGIITSGGSQTYDGAVTLGKDVTIKLNGSSAVALFKDTVSSDAVAPDSSLTITGSGTFEEQVSKIVDLTVSKDAVFKKNVSSKNLTVSENADFQSTVNLSGNLAVTKNLIFADIVNVSGTLSVGGSSTLNGSSVTSGGSQTYGGAVTVNSDFSFTGTYINFNDKLISDKNITITGNALVKNTASGKNLTVSENADFQSSVNLSGNLAVTKNLIFADTVNVSGTLSVGGTSTLNGSSITSGGSQTYGGAVTLGNDVTIKLNGSSAVALFKDTVSSDAVAPDSSLTITGSGTFEEQVSKIVDLTVSKDAVFKKNVSSKNLTVSENADFQSTVNLSGNLAVTKNLIFTDIVNVLGTLTVGGSSTLNGSSITSGGSQTYGGAVTLGTDVNLNLTEPNAGAIFKGIVSSDAVAPDSSLTITGSGTFEKSVSKIVNLSVSKDADFRDLLSLSGNLDALKNCSFAKAVNISGNLTVGGVSTLKGGSISSGGDQTYKGSVILQVDSNLSGKKIQFLDPITGEDYIFKTTANDKVVFGNDFLDTVSVKSIEVTGLAEIYGNNITSKENQLFNDNVKLFAERTTFNVEGKTAIFNGIVEAPDNNIAVNGNSIFQKKVSGKNLTVSENADFNDSLTLSGNFAVTQNLLFENTADVLGTLSVGGNSTLNGSSITSGGNQTYNGTVTLGTDVSLNLNNPISFAIFKDTVSSDNTAPDSSLDIKGSVTFEKAVSKVVDLTVSKNASFLDSLSLSGNLLILQDCNFYNTVNVLGNLTIGRASVISGGAVTTTGNQTYNGIVTLKNDLYITGNDLSFSSGLSGRDFDYVMEASSFDLSGPFVVKNYVQYGGSSTLGQKASLTTAEDFLLLGPDYKSSSEERPDDSEYSYTKPRLSHYSFNADLPDAGLKSPTQISKAGVFAVTSNVTVSVGKNFYANSYTLKNITGGSDENNWFLDIGQNSKADICFAEAYLCDVSNSTVRNLSSRSENAALSMVMAENCTFDGGKTWVSDDDQNIGTNRNWDFQDFTIVSAHTVSDSVVYVEFSRPVRNSLNQFNSLVSKVYYTKNGANDSYKKLYSDYYYDTQSRSWVGTELGSEDILSRDGKYFVYIQTQNDADSRWNTDATGTSGGNVNSTDSYSRQNNADGRSVIPTVYFERNVPESITFTNIYGKILKNSGAVYDETTDMTPPVLISVFSGQEIHQIAGSVKDEDLISSGTLYGQHSYDGHNFLQFRYSEPVDIDTGDGKTVILSSDVKENVPVSEKMGQIDVSEGYLSVKGFVEIESGNVKSGSIDSEVSGNLVHSLYRKKTMIPHTVRLSVCGLVSGSVKDNSERLYNRWIGYLDSAATPESGSRITVSNNPELFVYDVTPQKNRSVAVKSDGLSLNITNLSSLENDLGPWDVSKPVFAGYRRATDLWSEPLETYNFEVIGSTVDGTSSLKRLEFHLFDNKPLYNQTEPQWVSKIGFAAPYNNESETPSLYKDYSYAADIFGGSRPFAETGRTSGGIRYSSICDSSGAFSYGVGKDSEPVTAFDNKHKAYFGASSAFFQPATQPSRNPDEPDGLYFGYNLSQTVLSLRTQFVVNYDSSKGFVTDLAGNRLDSAKIYTIDLTPPSVNMTVAPVGQKNLYVMFSKELELENNVSLVTVDGETVSKNPLSEALPSAFVLCTIPEGTSGEYKKSELQIDSSVPAKLLYSNSKDSYMGIQFALTREVSLWDVMNLYLVAKKEEADFKDPVIDLETNYATFIQDDTGIGNYMPAFSAHALSDFAVNAVDPLYAYNTDFASRGEKGEQAQINLYSSESFAVHDWNAEQENYGTLLSGDEIHIVARVPDSGLSSEENAENQNNQDFKVRLFATNKPDAESVSTEYNTASQSFLRVWLPEIPFSSLSKKANMNFTASDSKYLKPGDLSGNLDFVLSKEAVEKFAPGDQISFMFGLLDSNGESRKICHSPVYDYSAGLYTVEKNMPLFALRLKNPSDILSLDLWSFRLKAMSGQRGGVTILNNVIDAGRGEKTVIKVDSSSDLKKVDVIVMTLDGNVVDYLSRGSLEKGTHYFFWNGTNRSGRQVARGMYFVRVIGSGFDETRKVMVVK